MIEVSCSECGLSIKRYKSQVKEKNYCSRECLGKWRSRQTGENAAHWKGGFRNDRGRIQIYMPTHHRAGKKGYVYRYWLVAEEMLGRLLLPEEVVDHKDGDHTNDSPANLAVYPSQSEHARRHGRERTRGQMESMRQAKGRK